MDDAVYFLEFKRSIQLLKQNKFNIREEELLIVLQEFS